MAAAAQKKTDTKGKVNCSVCEGEIDEDHIGVRCLQGHHLCTDCSPNFIAMTLENPQLTLPPKCFHCAADVVLNSFERNLTPEQLNIFLPIMLEQELGKDDIIVNCSRCGYFETRYDVLSKDEILFSYCRKPSCRKVTCLLCLKECNPVEDEYYDDESADIESHFICAQFAPLKTRFEKALALASGKCCPGCGVQGMKDDSCTHMTCVKCSTVWCYVCGKKEADLNKSNPNGNIYQHNDNFYSRDNRCPMYLTNLAEVDESWPEDDQDAKAKLHRLQTLKALRTIYDEIRAAGYRELIRVFPQLGAPSGFTEADILSEDADPQRPIYERNLDFEETEEYI